MWGWEQPTQFLPWLRRQLAVYLSILCQHGDGINLLFTHQLWILAPLVTCIYLLLTVTQDWSVFADVSPFRRSVVGHPCSKTSRWKEENTCRSWFVQRISAYKVRDSIRMCLLLSNGYWQKEECLSWTSVGGLDLPRREKEGSPKDMGKNCYPADSQQQFYSCAFTSKLKGIQLFWFKIKKYLHFFNEKLLQFVLPVPTLWNKSNVTFPQLLLSFFLPSYPYPQVRTVLKKVKKIFGFVDTIFFFCKNALLVFLLLLPSCNNKNKKSSSEAIYRFWSYLV